VERGLAFSQIILSEVIQPSLRAEFQLSEVMVRRYGILFTSIADPEPNPDPLDPHVFGPPESGSGSISQRYGSGSGSFYHQAKK
jgi:hypothetical protein